MKLCVIGIDALDPDLLTSWSAELPTFRRLMNQGRWGRLRSTFPPDSVPAWTTIYTGRDPSEHGGLEYVDYLDIRQGRVGLDNSRLRGQTFWDRIAESGRRVLVLNPFMAYPAWNTNGVMVSGPVFVDGSVSVTPAGTTLPSTLPELGGMVEFPTRRTLKAFYERCVEVTEAQSRFFETMLSQHPWDFAYVLFLTLDRVKHFYWRFEDTEDPTHVSWPERPRPILDFYRLMDRLLSNLLDTLPPDAAVLLISDHGHQRRCTRLLYVNELLRRAGFLEAPRGLKSLLAPNALLERVKNLALDTAFRFAMEEQLARVAKWVPRRKALKRGDHVIVADRSVARTSSFAGVNPFGGIVLNHEEITRRGLNAETVARDIMDLLRGVRDDRTGRPVVRWAKSRDEAVPAGSRVEAYPDVLFELEPEYGVSWSIFRPLLGPSITHRKISGGHRRDGVIMANTALLHSTSLTGRSVGDVHRIVLEQFELLT